MIPLDNLAQQTSGKAHSWLILLMALGMFLAAGSCPVEARQMGKLDIVAGKSIVLRSDQPVKRISIADPAVADFVLISPKEIYITARTAGTTNLILWHEKGRHDIYDVEVSYDIARLKQQLNKIFPGENDLRVTATQDTITLSGRISSASNLSHAMAVAQSYAPEGKVNNLVEVRGVQQVMLEVRVSEMQRSLLRRLGVNFNYLRNGAEFGVSKLTGLTELVKPLDANISSDIPGLNSPFNLFVSPSVNALFRFNTGGTTWTGFIDALKSDGLVKVLAEPTLIALSGEKAEFNAGGEFPVPVPQGLGTVAIEYRNFGVSLEFTPTVLANNKINIRVKPTVSELDFSTAVQFSGFVVPGLSSRSAATVVELADGQSFAIAGLMSNTVRDVVDKLPVLGDIPIIGALFRSRAFKKNETELIIIATPHLVKPMQAGTQPLPTDFYVEPSDADIYITGLLEGREDTNSNRMRGELDGKFGHAVPHK